MKKLIGSIVILAVLVAGGYIGYRMLFKGETFFEAIGAAQRKVQDRLSPLGEKMEDRLPPLGKADYEYGKGNYEEAVKSYKEALARSDSPGATDKEKLTPDKRRDVLRRIADGQYGIAAGKDWPANLVKEARDSYELLLREYPNLGSADRQAIQTRIAKLAAQGM